ncbi:MAG TPA: M48 family metallopeptidase [Vicinamibacteria bacterium]|nr:M48 family metallopeptidase [Vicinamibacteria bacterium]
MFRTFSRPAVAAALFSLSLASATPAAAINLFSVQQDAEVGRQAAQDAERQLPMLRDGMTEGYINAIVQRLAAVAPGPRFPYRAHVVNAAEINAFALPGGYVYVNRGLIEAVRNEGELAGVLAHEMAHVAQRHGTSQATKAYGAQMGVGLLGSLLGGRDQRLGVPEQVIGSLGLNALFMKFSRNAESEADRVGAQMMSRAGYDPMAMANFFDLLAAQQRGNPSGVSQFFSDHPSPQNRSASIRALAAQLGRGRGAQVGGLQTVQARLDQMPAASRRQGLARTASRLRRR